MEKREIETRPRLTKS